MIEGWNLLDCGAWFNADPDAIAALHDQLGEGIGLMTSNRKELIMAQQHGQ